MSDELKLELNDDDQDPTYAPGSPTPDDPGLTEITEDIDGPTYAPGSPLPDDEESDEDEPQDPSAEIIQ